MGLLQSPWIPLGSFSCTECSSSRCSWWLNYRTETVQYAVAILHIITQGSFTLVLVLVSGLPWLNCVLIMNRIVICFGKLPQQDDVRWWDGSFCWMPRLHHLMQAQQPLQQHQLGMQQQLLQPVMQSNMPVGMQQMSLGCKDKMSTANVATHCALSVLTPISCYLVGASSKKWNASLVWADVCNGLSLLQAPRTKNFSKNLSCFDCTCFAHKVWKHHFIILQCSQAGHVVETVKIMRTWRFGRSNTWIHFLRPQMQPQAARGGHRPYHFSDSSSWTQTQKHWGGKIAISVTHVERTARRKKDGTGMKRKSWAIVTCFLGKTRSTHVTLFLCKLIL